MTKIMRSKSEGASTTGQKRQAKIAVLELSLGRELKSQRLKRLNITF